MTFSILEWCRTYGQILREAGGLCDSQPTDYSWKMSNIGIGLDKENVMAIMASNEDAITRKGVMGGGCGENGSLISLA